MLPLNGAWPRTKGCMIDPYAKIKLCLFLISLGLGTVIYLIPDIKEWLMPYYSKDASPWRVILSVVKLKVKRLLGLR